MDDTMLTAFVASAGVSCGAGNLGSFWSSADVFLVIILAGLAFLAYRHFAKPVRRRGKNIKRLKHNR